MPRHEFTEEECRRGQESAQESIAAKTAEQKRAFLVALEQTRGNVKEGCKAAGVGRRTFFNWVEADGEFTHDYEDVLAGALDDAEQMLFAIGAGLRKGNTSALCAILNARGKGRGYGFGRIEHTGAGGAAIIFQIVDFAAGGKGSNTGEV